MAAEWRRHFILEDTIKFFTENGELKSAVNTKEIVDRRYLAGARIRSARSPARAEIRSPPQRLESVAISMKIVLSETGAVAFGFRRGRRLVGNLCWLFTELSSAQVYRDGSGLFHLLFRDHRFWEAIYVSNQALLLGYTVSLLVGIPLD